MEQQDYLRRQIEQIGLVLGGLLNLLRGRRPDDGKPIVFKTPAAALMYFVSQGWEIYDNGADVEGDVTVGTGSNRSTTYWVIRKSCTKEEFEAVVEAGIKK